MFVLGSRERRRGKGARLVERGLRSCSINSVNNSRVIGVQQELLELIAAINSID